MNYQKQFHSKEGNLWVQNISFLLVAFDCKWEFECYWLDLKYTLKISFLQETNQYYCSLGSKKI